MHRARAHSRQADPTRSNLGLGLRRRPDRTRAPAAGRRDQPRRPFQVDAIIGAELQRALGDPNPLRGSPSSPRASGANQPDDAIYPLNVVDAGGQPLSGNHDYVLHFDKAELPPVDAFWSVTMYDGEGFQAANPINRFAIGDRDDLSFNEDGSLDLYLQHDSPGERHQSNWLPAPRGPLGVTMRLYAPAPQALDGRWTPPATKMVR